MFEAITATEGPLAIRVSFWQCFRAGVAFTSGAMVVMFLASVFWFVVMASVMPRVLLGALSR